MSLCPSLSFSLYVIPVSLSAYLYVSFSLCISVFFTLSASLSCSVFLPSLSSPLYVSPMLPPSPCFLIPHLLGGGGGGGSLTRTVLTSSWSPRNASGKYTITGPCEVNSSTTTRWLRTTDVHISHTSLVQRFLKVALPVYSVLPNFSPFMSYKGVPKIYYTRPPRVLSFCRHDF